MLYVQRKCALTFTEEGSASVLHYTPTSSFHRRDTEVPRSERTDLRAVRAGTGRRYPTVGSGFGFYLKNSCWKKSIHLGIMNNKIKSRISVSKVGNGTETSTCLEMLPRGV